MSKPVLTVRVQEMVETADLGLVGKIHGCVVQEEGEEGNCFYYSFLIGGTDAEYCSSFCCSLFLFSSFFSLFLSFFLLLVGTSLNVSPFKIWVECVGIPMVINLESLKGNKTWKRADDFNLAWDQVKADVAMQMIMTLWSEEGKDWDKAAGDAAGGGMEGGMEARTKLFREEVRFFSFFEMLDYM